jgi:sirohydrochlorin ferrochelatase
MSQQSANEPYDSHALRLAPETLESLGWTADTVGIVIVDHGSRRDESNEMLLQVAAMFREASGWPIVEPAHMELAEPSIQTAFDRAVAQGARLVIVHPYLLAPGRHWRHDIPRLAAQAAQRHDGVQHRVTDPLGLHPLIVRIIQDRVVRCLVLAQDG